MSKTHDDNGLPFTLGAPVDGGSGPTKPRGPTAEEVRRASVREAETARNAREAQEAAELERYKDSIRWLAGILKPVLYAHEEGNDDLEVTPEMRRGALEQLRQVFARGIELDGSLRARARIGDSAQTAPIAHCHVPIEGGVVVYYTRPDFRPRVVEVDGFRYPLVCGPNWLPADTTDMRAIDELVKLDAAVVYPPGTSSVVLPVLSDDSREARREALAAWNLRDEPAEEVVS